MNLLSFLHSLGMIRNLLMLFVVLEEQVRHLLLNMLLIIVNGLVVL